ncbi:MAG: nucleotidyltransferase domain-containing protein [Gammaproteobacteria bacterium]
MTNETERNPKTLPGTDVPQAARELIEARLAEIAAAQRVTILYACESGSRAWGFPSPDSDYDVRFIYLRPSYWYLSLTEGRDVIDLALEETPAGVLDLGGWDLRKALRLVMKSNPVIWEWLRSPIRYGSLSTPALTDFRKELDRFYSPITACHHYLSICRNTMQQALQGRQVKIKKYFYMLRPLLAATWIERYQTIPPMELAALICLMEESPAIKTAIVELQARKQGIDEQIPIDRLALVDEFLASELSRLLDAAKNLPGAVGDRAELDRLFQQFLGL